MTVCVSVKFVGCNISIYMLLFPHRLQLSCTRKLTGNNYSLCSSFLARLFRFLWHTRVKASSRGAKHRAGNFHRRNASYMRRTNMCAYRSISASAPRGNTTLDPHQYQTWRLCRMIGGVTMEINSPNCHEIHWIREMLRQGMVVARHATATYTEVVVQ